MLSERRDGGDDRLLQAEAGLALIRDDCQALKGGLTKAIFSEDVTIDDPALLESLILHRARNIRRAALEIAKRDSLLTVDIANRLLSDSDADIRFEALTYLIQAGKAFTDVEAKNALVKPTPGILYSNDLDGERTFESYQAQKLKELAVEQLDEKVESSSVYVFVPYLARAEKHFDHYGDTLRADIDDQFRKYFDGRIAYDEAILGRGSSEQTKGLSEFIRKKMTRAALDVLCSKMIANDISLLRRVLESEFVDYSDNDVAYLSRFGTWDDVPLLTAMTNRPAYRGASLMLFSSDKMYLTVAKAILRLSRGRLREVLEFEMPVSLKKAMITNASQTSFAKLSTELLCRLLRSDDINLRRSICLKSLAVFKKARLKKILKQYVSGEELHYYNVIHWFDFGISMPAKIVIPAVKRRSYLTT